MSKHRTKRQVAKDDRRFREQQRTKKLYTEKPPTEKKFEDMTTNEQLVKAADDLNKALEWLFEQKLVRAGASAKMRIEGEGEQAYLLLMFNPSTWEYKDKKFAIKTGENGQ